MKVRTSCSASEIVVGKDAVGQLLAKIAGSMEEWQYQVVYMGMASRRQALLTSDAGQAAANREPIFLVTAAGYTTTEQGAVGGRQ